MYRPASGYWTRSPWIPILKARNLAITEQQHIWQLSNIPDIHLVTMWITGVDPNGNAQDVVKCTVTSQTASVLQWDSLTPTQAWSQFDKAWEFDQGTKEY